MSTPTPAPTTPAAVDDRPRIVVVDDDPAMLRLLQVSLKRAFSVHPAEDGLDALDVIAEVRPSVVVSDFHMPNMSGVALCRRIKSQPETRHVPVILLTADSDPANIESSLDSGADDYVCKPFRKAELVARVRAAHRSHEIYMQLDRTHSELKASQDALLQRQKFEAVGRLADGVAHEINTPLQFLCDNCRFLDESFADLILLADLATDGKFASLEALLERHRLLSEEKGLEFLREQVPGAIGDTLDGLEKVSSIVRALMVYSEPHGEAKSSTELAPILEAILPLIETQFQTGGLSFEIPADLPPFWGAAEKIREVILSVVANALEAVERQDREELGVVKLSARSVGDSIEISVEDDGPGISPDDLSRVFDPFFTTKPEGAGTGQGLAAARQIVVEEHSGALDIDSTPGRGTTITVRLPLVAPELV